MSAFIVDGHIEIRVDVDSQPYFTRVPNRALVSRDIDDGPETEFFHLEQNPDDGKLMTLSVSNGAAVYRLEACSDDLRHYHATLVSWAPAGIAVPC